MEMTFLDDYFNNGDGTHHVADPHPPSYYLWGAGGAAYYNAQNERGTTSVVAGGDFEAPAVAGQQPAPQGGPWSFSGTAGLLQGAAAGSKPGLYQPNGDPKPANAQEAYLQGGGSLSQTITFPASTGSNIYGVELQAAERTLPGAAKPGSEPFQIFLDGQALNHDAYTPRGDGWQSFYSSTFQAQPGSTHVLSIAGTGTGTDGTAVIDNVGLDSVDAIFAGDIPSNGNGQKMESYLRRLQIANDWALMYGLHPAAYEGGWALGGDMGGTPVQNAAKFGDRRALAAQTRAIDAWYATEGSLFTFGTYSQWDDWNKADSEPLGLGIVF